MGVGQSKEAFLFEQVVKGNIQGVQALHSNGASIEWFNDEGKTPLIEACMHPQLYEVAKLLIDLGANVNAYRPGRHNGTALHHAAKRGLAPTVKLLLSHGANALAMNGDALTPLEVARRKGFSRVVRTIESHICFFSGWIRELYGPGFLEALAPQLLSRKIWIVVVPSGSRNPRKPLKLELAMYTSLQDAQPRTTITLWKAKIDEPKFNQQVPVLNIYDKATRTRYKLASSDEHDKQQLQWLCNACRGIPQVMHPTLLPNTHTTVGPLVAPPSNAEDLELAMTLNASLSPAMEHTQPVRESHLSSMHSSTNDWGDAVDNSSHNGWLSNEGPAPSEAISSGWLDEPPVDTYNGWGAPDTASSSNPTQETSVNAICGIPGTASSRGSSNNPSYNGWGLGLVEVSGSPSNVSSSDWLDKQAEAVHNGWSSAETTSSDLAQNNRMPVVPVIHDTPLAPSAPSAPLISEDGDYGPIHYPSIDCSPVDMTTPNVENEEAKTNQVKEEVGASSTCVICLDAPVEGACIPCGHMAGCMSCLKDIEAKKWGCPVCRSKIDQVIRLFVV